MNELMLLVVGIVILIPGAILWITALRLHLRQKTFGEFFYETDNLWLSLKLFFNPRRMFSQFWRLLLATLLLSIGATLVTIALQTLFGR